MIDDSAFNPGKRLTPIRSETLAAANAALGSWPAWSEPCS
jgi:hypothetical protein